MRKGKLGKGKGKGHGRHIDFCHREGRSEAGAGLNGAPGQVVAASSPGLPPPLAVCWVAIQAWVKYRFSWNCWDPSTKFWSREESIKKRYFTANFQQKICRFFRAQSGSQPQHPLPTPFQPRASPHLRLP